MPTTNNENADENCVQVIQSSDDTASPNRICVTKKKFTGGEIAGISIGAVFGFILLAAMVYVIYMEQQRKQKMMRMMCSLEKEARLNKR